MNALNQPNEPVYTYAYFGLIIAELYSSTRLPFEAAQALIFASSNLNRTMPLLGALLTEKTSHYFMMAGQERKLGFNQVFCAHKYFNLGGKALKHATACFAVACIIYEESQWSDAKIKLYKSIVKFLPFLIPYNNKYYILSFYYLIYYLFFSKRLTDLRVKTSGERRSSSMFVTDVSGHRFLDQTSYCL